MNSKKSFSSETANRYSLALYELAEENSELAVVEKNINELLVIYDSNDELKNFIKNPTQSQSNQFETLNKISKRVMVVLDPVELIIDNYPDGNEEILEAENNPEDESYGFRKVPFSKYLYIERDDFKEEANRKYFRLSIGKEVRLKDVQLLFADASTGARSTSMVSQGRVGAIIAAKPEQRRSLLEEAAGITGLHSRRHEAELRLNSTENNLERVKDVLKTQDEQLEILKKQSKQAKPVILMGYYNMIFQYGDNSFINVCKKVGVDGLIVVDLPYPENRDFAKKCKKKNINFIQLVSPTTSLRRMKKIIKSSHDMVYYISMLSTTGGKLKVSSNKILERYNKIKNLNKNKNIVIGFGITEKTIASLKKADGLVVGSALCKEISKSLKKRQNPVTNVTNIVRRLRNKII